jgi:APA family basic amino acid/polyamine antiporter
MVKKHVKLKRALTLFDAVSIGLGAIIGAGIYVVVGIASGAAGPGVMLSVILAGIIASFTALSFAALGSAIIREGGAYEYVYELISPSLGFFTGWLWVFGQIVAGAAVSLGFATYLSILLPLPVKFVAAGACLLFMFLNLVGVKQSSLVNDTLVASKILVLLIFVAVGVSYIKLSNFIPLMPNGFFGVVNGAALIFFAFLGYGRITTISEEVKNPERVVPLSILLALGISSILYLLVSFTAVGIAGSDALSSSASPLAVAMGITGNELAVLVVSAGGILATASVLLTTLLGVSRVFFSMARNKQMPEFINTIHPHFRTPYISILFSGFLMAALAFFGDLKQVVSLASFSVISTHILVNYAAFKLRNRCSFKIPLYPIPPLLGMVSCAALALSLLPHVWVLVSLVLLAGVVFSPEQIWGKKQNHAKNQEN